MTNALTFAPLIAWPLLIIAAVMACVIAILFLFRSPLSGIFRALALATLLGILANPILQSDERTPLDDIVLVLVDRSQSQQLDGRADITTQITERLTERGNRAEYLDIRFVEITGDQETRLAEGLRDALGTLQRQQLAAIFIVTDGQASDIALPDDTRDAPPSPLAGLIPGGVPLHVLLTGRADEVDRLLTLKAAPRYGIVRESVRVSFRIEDVGPNRIARTDKASVPVVLRVDGREILRENVETGIDVGFDVPLERPGEIIVELQVATLEGELTNANNIVVLPITAVRDRLRVLLISGEPNPGERVWRNLLKSDPSIDMVHFTILRTADKFDAAQPNELALIPFPTNELFIEKLREFDLIIFDRYTWRNVLKSYHFDNIARFVEEGGAMLVASGPEFNGRLSLSRRRTISYLLPLLPLEGSVETPFRPTLTDAGKRHPVTAGLPDQEIWGRWIRAIPTAIREGTSLMAGPDDLPILVLNRVGKGRVGMIQSDHIWLWARGFDGGGPHAELLRRTAHWLMKEPQLEEEQLRLSAATNTLIISRQTLSDTAGPVIITLPDNSTRTVTPTQIDAGQFEARLEDMEPGLYRAASGDLFAIGAIGLAAAPELQDVVSEDRKLTPLAQLTRGGIFSVRPTSSTLRLPAFRQIGPNLRESAARSGPGWAGIVRRDASRVDGRTTAPFTSPWVWLGLIALFLGIAWYLESRPNGSKT